VNPSNIDWRPILNGMGHGGYAGGRQIVMVTGPHPNGRYAATFLFAPEGARWELFASSLERAKRRAEVVCALHPRAQLA
jgi:hypothetical protein